MSGWFQFTSHPRERLFWIIVLVTLHLDVGLTLYGMRHGFVELNPIARALMAAAGTGGLLLPKIIAIAAALAGRHVLRPDERWVVPLGMAGPWILAVLLNVYVVTLS